MKTKERFKPIFLCMMIIVLGIMAMLFIRPLKASAEGTEEYNITFPYESHIQFDNTNINLNQYNAIKWTDKTGNTIPCGAIVEIEAYANDGYTINGDNLTVTINGFQATDATYQNNKVTFTMPDIGDNGASIDIIAINGLTTPLKSYNISYENSQMKIYSDVPAPVNGAVNLTGLIADTDGSFDMKGTDNTSTTGYYAEIIPPAGVVSYDVTPKMFYVSYPDDSWNFSNANDVANIIPIKDAGGRTIGFHFHATPADMESKLSDNNKMKIDFTEVTYPKVIPPTYTVSYNANGATSGTAPTDSNTYANGANVPLAGNSGNLTKTGYTFGGWSLTTNGTAVTSYTMEAKAVTLYAVWTLSNSGASSNSNSTTSSSTNSGSLNTPAVMPFPANSNGIGSIVNQVQKAKDGESVDINMNGTTTLKSEWLEEIAGRDVDVVLDMGNGVKWTINGKSITGKDFKDIDLKVIKGTKIIPADVLNKLTGGKKAIPFTVTHSGEFGFTATISMELGEDNEGLYANLYYYNEATKSFEFIGVCRIGKDGSVAWDLEHTSTYAVVIDKVSLAPENVEAGAGVEVNESLVNSNVADSKNNSIAFVVVILISTVLVAAKLKKHRNLK